MVPGSRQRYWSNEPEETSNPVAPGFIQQGNHTIAAANQFGRGAQIPDYGSQIMSNSLPSMDTSGTSEEDPDFQYMWNSFIIERSPKLTGPLPNEHMRTLSPMQATANTANNFVFENQNPASYPHFPHTSVTSIHVNSWAMEAITGTADIQEMESRMKVIGSRIIETNVSTQQSQHNHLYSISVAGSHSQVGVMQGLNGSYVPYPQTLLPSLEMPSSERHSEPYFPVPHPSNMYHGQIPSGSNLPSLNGNLRTWDGISYGISDSITPMNGMPMARRTAESRRDLRATETQLNDPAHQRKPFGCEESVCEEYDCNQRPCNVHRCGKRFYKEYNFKRHIEEHQNRRGEVSDKLSCPVLDCTKQNAWTRDRIWNLRDHLVKSHKLTDECPRCHAKFGKNLLEHLMLPGTKCGVKLKWKGKANVEGYDKGLPRGSPPPSAFTNPVIPLE